jgi:hypothetical protein
MNITTQTAPSAQGHQLQHSRVFSLNGPSNSVVANMAWQLNQQFKQASYGSQFNIADITNISPCITRVRLVMHDACILCVQSMVNSLDPQLTARLEQNELYYWKRDQGAISNA